MYIDKKNDTDNDSPVNMPHDGQSSYQVPPTPPNPSRYDHVFVILQHCTRPAPNFQRAVLPVSNVKAVFEYRMDVQRFLQAWKAELRAHGIVQQSSEELHPRRPQFWNTTGLMDEGGRDTEGFRYNNASGEEFTVWVEQQELKWRFIPDMVAGLK